MKLPLFSFKFIIKVVIINIAKIVYLFVMDINLKIIQRKDNMKVLVHLRMKMKEIEVGE
jgi:hypothetical protein